MERRFESPASPDDRTSCCSARQAQSSLAFSLLFYWFAANLGAATTSGVPGGARRSQQAERSRVIGNYRQRVTRTRELA
jgi:hypothetical protein